MVSCSGIWISRVLPSQLSGSLQRVEVADDRLGLEPGRDDRVRPAVGADQVPAARVELAQQIEIDGAAADDHQQAVERQHRGSGERALARR